METLTKIETVAAISAIVVIIRSSPGVLPRDHPLITSVKKLEKNLEEFNEEEIRSAS